jgi:SAM-dependent methyltransferase
MLRHLILSFITVSAVAAFSLPRLCCSRSNIKRPVKVLMVTKHDERPHDSLDGSSKGSQPTSAIRRRLFASVASSTAGLYSSTNLPFVRPCRCCMQRIPSANALVDLKEPSSKLVDVYDPARNQIMDSIFSWSMSNTMGDYENEARPYKAKLFQSLFDSLAKDTGNEAPVIVEIGMGTFPNAPYFAQSMLNSRLKALDIIGVDPNDSMKQYALENAEKSGLIRSNVSLRIVHGVAEALPFADSSVNAAIVTLTLCSVRDPERVVSEIQRILKPNTGKFVFWEHVLSETDPGLALQQQILSPLQTMLADGCHLNRRTGSIIKDAGFLGGVDLESTIMNSADIIGPTVYGIATV